MILLGDCQLQGLIKTRVEQYLLSHFINTRRLCHTLVSILGQSPSWFRRISHQFQKSLASEWLKFKLTSQKAKWCYVNLFLETVAMENKHQSVCDDRTRCTIHSGLKNNSLF